MHANHFQVWNVHSVLNVLHSLVDKSNINKQLEVRSSIAYILVLVGDQIKLNSHKYSSNLPLKVYNNQGNPDSVAGDFGRHSLYKMLGYFSLVGLLR